MKKLNVVWIILFAFSLTLNTSCKKDDDGNGINVGDGCTASWEVDGTAYEKNDMALCVYLDGTLNLTSSISGGDFQLQIDPITSTGTYIADPGNGGSDVVIIILLDDGTRIGSSNASVVVSTLSNQKAKGTFSGDFYDLQDLNQAADFSVTKGKFEANF